MIINTPTQNKYCNLFFNNIVSPYDLTYFWWNNTTDYITKIYFALLIGFKYNKATTIVVEG